MPTVDVNGIKLAYESHGNESAPPVLLIMGLGAQLTMWPDQLIRDITGAGFRAVTFDNRDIGLSHKHDGERVPKPIPQMLAKRIGITLKTPYRLVDMAGDAAGLMTALEIDNAHIVGVSMGGMIAQHLAALHPSRVASVTAIMTTTGNPKLPRPGREVFQAMLRRGPVPETREGRIDMSVATFGVIGTPGEDHNTNGMRDRITASYDRNYDPSGLARQMAGIIASGDFRKMTRRVQAPTLVIHGSADPLVPVEGGMDIARLVRGARLEVIDGMGHDMPPRFLPKVTGMMLDHFKATELLQA
ncbi:MAG: alpha/beta hydrolase [Henriciella sp.]|nr:alpha/beta hydrolase [Henriciella sp.]